MRALKTTPSAAPPAVGVWAHRAQVMGDEEVLDFEDEDDGEYTTDENESDADSDSDTNTGRRGSSERQPLTKYTVITNTVIEHDLNGFDDDECQLEEKKDGQLTGDGAYNCVTVRAYEFSAGSVLQMPHISEEKSIIGFATLPGGEVLVAHNAVRNSKNFVDCHKLTDVFSYIKNDGPRSRELVAATKKMACDATVELIKSSFQR